MNLGVVVGIGIDVNFPDDEYVKEVSEDIVVTPERVGEAELDRVILDDTDELAEWLGVFVNWIDPDTVAVWNLGVWVIFGENVIVGEELDVLLSLGLVVPFDVAVDERVPLVLADRVRVPNPLRVAVELPVDVLEEASVLETEEEPVDVLLRVAVLVSVELIRGVNVPLGEGEADAEAVGVLEERTVRVVELEAVGVLDCGADLV